MRIPIRYIVGTFLILLCACRPASAVMCKDMEDSRIDELESLYKYAELVESAKQGDLNYMKECVYKKMIDTEGEVNISVKKPNTMNVYIPMEFIEIIPSAFEEEVGSRANNYQAISQPQTKDSEGKIVQFVVGCRRKNSSIENAPVEGIILTPLVASDLRNSFYLKAKEAAGTIIVDESGEENLVFHGTDLTEFTKIFSNFNGEDCLFPLVKITVELFCTVLRSNQLNFHIERYYSTEHDDDIWHDYISAFAKDNHDIISQSESRSLTMVGHSLGGSATQFVALNFPYECLSGDSFNEFKAFVFASTGLKDSNPMSESQQGAQSLNRRLTSVLINGDRALKFANPFFRFLKRFQIGRIAVFEPTKGSGFWRHKIDDVQRTLCSCLQGEGSVRYESEIHRNSEIFAK